jgi:tetratricopeptide (TPR) repeat protein
LLYDKKRYEEAITHWEAATRVEPNASIPWRNLGLAHYNVRHDRAQARVCYEQALQANPNDARLLSELDQLLKRQGETPSSRLARLEQRLDLVEQRDDLTVERATLYNLLQQPETALQIMLSRRFHPWEGGEGRVSDQYEGAHLMLGRTALEAGQAAEALAHFQQARTFPDNLGEGRFATTSLAHVDYWTGRAWEAMGEAAQAKECYEQAARPQSMVTPTAYYRALALRKLGQNEAARQQLRAMLDYASNELEQVIGEGFDTSAPQFIFFEEDALKPRRIALHYLIGLAYLGLNHTAEARKVFHEVLALDGNHLGAQEELRRPT